MPGEFKALVVEVANDPTVVTPPHFLCNESGERAMS